MRKLFRPRYKDVVMPKTSYIDHSIKALVIVYNDLRVVHVPFNTLASITGHGEEVKK
jgi:hypothetical protein